ncbi:capsular polysaccharide biosynthesis protein Cap8F [Alkalihalobacillus alcalophilus ATCC 27647 = CGMCC 1.3604]|uniref:Capsular biosynthesis protein n=1 Tax=Alkalihalobacillus alcalophilus ATCC 27647 = CGMCC 1.3604 TaxID=1218173 RepID=A0A094XBY1_ALKAL|nr:capsular polysaccharide biosynthesis protein CapF [Alkalihalobacillus alcalophilus]KGA96285.1 capsular biosynthesis protein [Alkalihalobacillus alcalophilus ATCC 27647 = CGMCC 1.3604]MED1563387.1 capsular polysaccharide biosynthesis protein CapF [Alkalihalobacillus alcalophilus]THG91646.1 capsular polysaccharide biosynthesis protein Cap8F [Alkalihalobacillus alcalophilus ATCC 27647 = CGMCC 1.3604]
MKILVTGARGFVGKNLIAELKNRNYGDIFEYGRETDPSLLDEYCKEADFVFHLAGVNRPKDQSEFMDGNYGFTSTLLDTLKKHQNTCPVMISSSTQSILDNPYGISKKAGEDLIFGYSKITGAKVLVYRLPNVFGKWCKPNYNSAVATFCHNVAHELPINVHDSSVVMNLVYIDDVVEELIRALKGKENKIEEFCEVPVVYKVTLGEVVDLLYSFKKSREERSIPDMSNLFTKKLYSTYLSYLPEDKFSYELKMNLDQRGSFTEFIKTPDRGQVSVNISKPGITKGNHWHHTKNEKFLVVSGTGVIRFRKIGTEEIIEYFVTGDKMEVVDIPTGYTHNIENLGDTDMVTIMWANEYFDPKRPDTYFLEV